MEKFKDELKKLRVEVSHREWDQIKQRLDKDSLSQSPGQNKRPITHKYALAAAVLLAFVVAIVAMMYVFMDRIPDFRDTVVLVEPMEEEFDYSAGDEIVFGELRHRLTIDAKEERSNQRPPVTAHFSNIKNETFVANHPSGSQWLVQLQLNREEGFCSASINSINDKPLGVVLKPGDEACNEFIEDPGDTRLVVREEGQEERLYLVLREELPKKQTSETISMELKRIY